MSVPRDLDGRTFANYLIRKWQSLERRQSGSHLVRRIEHPSGQTLPVPAHKPLRFGTLAALLRMVSEHKQVTREDLLRDL